MEKIQYYRVTFGMNYDNQNNPSFHDELYLTTEDKLELSVPLYARFNGGKLKEVVTGMEIPMVLKKGIPGFGAYSLTGVFTIEDYRDLAHYLSICQKNKDQLKQSINEYILFINEQSQEFLATHMDFHGFLSEYYPEREIDAQDELDIYKQLVKKLDVGSRLETNCKEN